MLLLANLFIVKIIMAEYAMVRGNNEEVVGIWVKDKDLTKDTIGLQVLATKHHLPMDIFANLTHGNYRVVPNSYDNNGGYFLMFGKFPAPGENKHWWKFW